MEGAQTARDRYNSKDTTPHNGTDPALTIIPLWCISIQVTVVGKMGLTINKQTFSTGSMRVVL